MPPRIPDDDFEIDLGNLDFEGGLPDKESVPVMDAEVADIQKAFEDELVFNGINEDGQYGLDPMTSEQLSHKIQGESYYEDKVQRSTIQQKLVTDQPELNNLSQEQFNFLTKNLSDARRALIESLDPEHTKLFVDLIKKPWGLDLVVSAAPKLFSTLPQEQFEALLETQKTYYEEEVAKLKLELFEGLDDAQQAILDEMLEELWGLFHEQKIQQTLEGKIEQPFPVPADVDAKDLRQAGWGIIFPASMEDTKRNNIKQALAELINWRKQQIGDRVDTHFKIYERGQGYLFGESKDDFLQRHRVGSGIAYPEEMPFYLLLIGSPEEIPFEFQYQLDVMRAVGRLDFGADYATYQQYAHNVVLAESDTFKLAPNATFFAVRNDRDKATNLSSKYLITPLTRSKKLFPKQEEENGSEEKDISPIWNFNLYTAEQATKNTLRKILSGHDAPALLFTASHGMEFKMDDVAKQMKGQGALLCQDWPGSGAVKPEHYFAAEDVPSDANLLGMVAILFACYGAGTPREDQFEAKVSNRAKQIAERSFIAALPQQLLRQGVLAVMGHVERAWGYSFVSPGGFLENKHFTGLLEHLFRGEPIGWATDDTFNARYADRSSALSLDLQNPEKIEPRKLSQTWIASNDARGYVVLGDPAVRIPLAKNDEIANERPALDTPTDIPLELEDVLSTDEEDRDLSDLAAEDFGIREQVDDLTTSLREFTDQLAESLKEAAKDISTLEVKTYTTDDLSAVTTQSEGQARLRALTHIGFDGDMKIFVPEDREGEVDRALWNVHLEMVREAQANRAQFLQAMAEMATNLLKSLK